MKVAICTAVWRRHELTSIWWAGAQRICRRFAMHGLDAFVVVAGSEPIHAAMARAAGAEWVRKANEPLGAKWNAVTERAGELGADYVLILGSDDFLSDAVADRYVALLREGWLYLGLGGIYFYEPSSRRLALYSLRHAKASRHGAPIGAGRLLSARILRQVDFRPWQDTLNRRLDASMTSRCNLPPARLIRVGSNLQAVDVKTSVNLWPFDILHERYPRLTLREPYLSEIPEWEDLPALAAPEPDAEVAA